MKLFSSKTKERLQQCFPDKYFVFLESTTSTNDECKKLCREKKLKNIVVVADNQTQGRGRYGKTWESCAQKNLYISLLFQNMFLENIPALNLYLGVLVYEAILQISSSIYPLLTIKWPNDIYIGDKKIGGILIENTNNSLDLLVVGVGINVYALASEIPKTATSLFLECQNINREVTREILVNKLLQGFNLRDTSVWHSKFLEYSKRTRKYYYNYHKHGKPYSGILKELYENGSILIEDKNGQSILIDN